jgi:hypothetical protein
VVPYGHTGRQKGARPIKNNDDDNNNNNNNIIVKK